MITLLLLFALQTNSVPSLPTVSLDKLYQRLEHGSDTTYIVNLWATWCKPCVAELPHFDKLSKEVSDKPVKIILVSVDDVQTSEKVANFLTKKGIVCEVVLLDESKPHEWIDRVSESWSGAIPATLIVNRGANKREFYEQAFSYDQLSSTLLKFLQSMP